jgi:predicted nucleic acid-binding protein
VIYMDTSSFLKLFITEPQSSEVRKFVQEQSCVVISILTEIEAGVQLRGFVEGGTVTRSFGTLAMVRMSNLIGDEPFVRAGLEGSVFTTALAQHEKSAIHCRSLDRLHLAAMEELKITRLMTHDARQAEAARELGYQVSSPGL